MKKILFAIAALSLMSATLLDTKTVLCKSWKINSVNIIADGITKAKADMAKPGISVADKTNLKQQIDYLTTMHTEMQKSIFTFKSDGTYSVVGFQPETGKWSLSKDGKTIYSTKNKSTVPDTIDIIKLTDLEFKMSQRTPDGPMIIALSASPIKK